MKLRDCQAFDTGKRPGLRSQVAVKSWERPRPGFWGSGGGAQRQKKDGVVGGRFFLVLPSPPPDLSSASQATLLSQASLLSSASQASLLSSACQPASSKPHSRVAMGMPQ